jgi:hypothetical protein
MILWVAALSPLASIFHFRFARVPPLTNLVCGDSFCGVQRGDCEPSNDGSGENSDLV